MTIRMATHEMGFARDVSSNACFLEGGLVHEQGPPERIFKEPESERTRLFLRRAPHGDPLPATTPPP